jgi:hypothetical protein
LLDRRASSAKTLDQLSSGISIDGIESSGNPLFCEKSQKVEVLQRIAAQAATIVASLDISIFLLQVDTAPTIRATVAPKSVYYNEKSGKCVKLTPVSNNDKQVGHVNSAAIV